MKRWVAWAWRGTAAWILGGSLIQACNATPLPTPPSAEEYKAELCGTSNACRTGFQCRETRCLQDCSTGADCPARSTCVDGACWTGTSNGCQTSIDCDDGYACAAGTCSELPPPRACGDTSPCEVGAGCRAGECVYGWDPCDGVDNDRDGQVDEDCCADGFGDCDNDPTNGCETDLKASAVHCGACNQSCGADEACAQGTCMPTGCSPEVCDGLDNDCDGQVDNGDLLCGDTNMTCLAGACSACPTGRADCDGDSSNQCEADLRVDSANCGGCGVLCSAGMGCSAGSCQ